MKYQFFFKENVTYPVWTFRDPIFSDSRDPMIIFSDSRDPNRVPKTPLKNCKYLKKIRFPDPWLFYDQFLTSLLEGKFQNNTLILTSNATKSGRHSEVYFNIANSLQKIFKDHLRKNFFQQKQIKPICTGHADHEKLSIQGTGLYEYWKKGEATGSQSYLIISSVRPVNYLLKLWQWSGNNKWEKIVSSLFQRCQNANNLLTTENYKLQHIRT